MTAFAWNVGRHKNYTLPFTPLHVCNPDVLKIQDPDFPDRFSNPFKVIR